MRKYLLLSVAVLGLAIGGADAFGVTVTIDSMGLLPDYVPGVGSGLGGIKNASSSVALALSPDGQIAVGSVHGDIYWDGVVEYANADCPVYWSKTTGLVRRHDDWRDGRWTGIGSGTGTPGPAYTATIAGNLSGVSRYSNPVDQDYPDPHATTTALTPASSTLLASQNSVAGNDHWIAGYYSKNTGTYVDYAMRWGSAAANYSTIVYKKGVGNTSFTGVANNGACSGMDHHTTGATWGAIYWDGTGGTGVGVTNIPALAGNSTTKGYGLGISDNGSYVTGQMYLDGNVYYRAFRWSPGDASSMALAPVGTDTQSYGDDVSDNGMVVGWTYNSTNSNRACIWDASGQPHLLWDILAGAGLNMSGWQRLIQIYSITPDGQYVSGYGINSAGKSVGFVAQIPEPATMTFLALGGLALLRRRR